MNGCDIVDILACYSDAEIHSTAVALQIFVTLAEGKAKCYLTRFDALESQTKFGIVGPLLFVLQCLSLSSWIFRLCFRLRFRLNESMFGLGGFVLAGKLWFGGKPL